LARDKDLSDHIRKVTNGNWISLRDHLGPNYSWRDFKNIKEVFVVPYNISTMTLFEMATAGIPVAIPSRSFMHELRSKYSGVLSELSFLQVNRESIGTSHLNTPNDYTSPDFYDWWLDRADFYNLSLMPNVRFVGSVDELSQVSTRDIFENQESYDEVINVRNNRLISQRDNFLKTFLNSL
jgi:hypothetical protein